MEPTQILILLGLLVAVVIVLKILKATLKLIIIVAIIVAIAGYFGFDLLGVGREMFEEVEEPAAELVDRGMEMDLWTDNGEITEKLDGPIAALREIGFGVDVEEDQLFFQDQEDDSFQGQLDAEENKLSLNVDLEEEGNREMVNAIIQEVGVDTIPKDTRLEIIEAVEGSGDALIDFENGTVEIEDDRLEMDVSTDTDDTG